MVSKRNHLQMALIQINEINIMKYHNLPRLMWEKTIVNHPWLGMVYAYKNGDDCGMVYSVKNPHGFS